MPHDRMTRKTRWSLDFQLSPGNNRKWVTARNCISKCVKFRQLGDKEAVCPRSETSTLCHAQIHGSPIWSSRADKGLLKFSQHELWLEFSVPRKWNTDFFLFSLTLWFWNERWSCSTQSFNTSKRNWLTLRKKASLLEKKSTLNRA